MDGIGEGEAEAEAEAEAGGYCMVCLSLLSVCVYGGIEVEGVTIVMSRLKFGGM